MPTALITGATSGIGRACVERFSKANYKIIGVGRDSTVFETICEDALNLGAEGCNLLQADLSEPGAPDEIYSMVRNEHVLDVLVNCAGIAFEGTLDSIDVSQWDLVHRVNVSAPFFLVKALLPLLEAGGSGAVVNVSSIAGRTRSLSLGCHYTTSKAALIGMTRHLAAELGPKGVRVNCAAPSQTHTQMLDAALSPEQQSKLAEQVPLRRLGLASEQAEVIFFLASPAASYVNGAVVDVNGGLL